MFILNYSRVFEKLVIYLMNDLMKSKYCGFKNILLENLC